MKAELAGAQSTTLFLIRDSRAVPGCWIHCHVFSVEIKEQSVSCTTGNVHAKSSPQGLPLSGGLMFSFFSFREPEGWEGSKWGASNYQWDDASDRAKGQASRFLRGTTHQRKGWRPALWKFCLLHGLPAEQDLRRCGAHRVLRWVLGTGLRASLHFLLFAGLILPGICYTCYNTMGFFLN